MSVVTGDAELDETFDELWKERDVLVALFDHFSSIGGDAAVRGDVVKLLAHSPSAAAPGAAAEGSLKKAEEKRTRPRACGMHGAAGERRGALAPGAGGRVYALQASSAEERGTCNGGIRYQQVLQ